MVEANLCLEASYNSYHPCYAACLAQGSFFHTDHYGHTSLCSVGMIAESHKRQSMSKVWDHFTI